MRKGVNGFTLVELLVVVAIIGILAAIVIPQFSEYRKRAFDSRSLSNLRNAAAAEEAYFSDSEAYKSCSNGAECQVQLPGFRWSEGVDIAMTVVTGSSGVANHFTGKAFHSKGLKNSATNAFTWDSSQGGLQQ